MAATTSETPSFDELKQMALDHFWPHAQQVADFEKPDGLHVIKEGKGCWVEDTQGRKYLDVLSGMWLKNIGYGRTEIADAVYEQMQHITYSPENTTNIPALKLASKLASLSPDKMSRVFLVSGGSEAVESALKMAKAYHQVRGEPGRHKIISRKDSYHGASFAAMSLGGYQGTANFGPLLPGNIHVTQPNHYRCLYCSNASECNLECAKDVERAIEHEGPETVAAVIGEPISTTSMMIPHPEYWSTIRSACDKYGVLLIVDEVITGFGRTGKMFASEHWDLQPDIMTVAKGLSSGYMPIGAAIARKSVADVFIGGEEKTFRHLFTFGGHPASCAASLANLEILEGEGLVENSAQMGKYMYEQLQTLYEHPIVGDIRGGLGLLAGIELVKDRNTKEKFPKDVNLGEKLTRSFLKHSILIRQRGDVIYLSPPLCITSDEVDFVVRNVDEVLGEVERELE
ncbi:MAG: aspartate aminotransferase family protein [Chloroflexi bacterium]|nr:aspartate aminotransferase family protein [Chloroflexota bacterium]